MQEVYYRSVNHKVLQTINVSFKLDHIVEHRFHLNLIEVLPPSILPLSCVACLEGVDENYCRVQTDAAVQSEFVSWWCRHSDTVYRLSFP